jgi:SNF2 family DNA or RNA helicase
VKRIAISNAVSLDDHTEMEEKLSKVFHEGKKLYPFQYVGVKFGMLSGGAFIIGDDMGVGKTIQAIAYAALHPEQWPVLIVAPANVQYHWRKEILGWVKDATVQIVEKGTSKLEDVDFTVITYNKMNTQESNLLERGYNIVVFDESHYIKNHKAKRTKSSFKVAEQSDSIVLMSGTPIPNRPVEFYNSLCLVRPADWKGRWMNYVYRYCDAQKNERGYLVVNGASNLEELHALTRDFMIRRLKEEVLPELPEQVRQLLPVQPDKKQMKEYRENQESWFAQYASYQGRGGMPAGFVEAEGEDEATAAAVERENNRREEADRLAAEIAADKAAVEAAEEKAKEDAYNAMRPNIGDITGGYDTPTGDMPNDLNPDLGPDGKKLFDDIEDAKKAIKDAVVTNINPFPFEFPPGSPFEEMFKDFQLHFF